MNPRAHSKNAGLWLKRLTAALVGPLLVVGALELTLRLAGYGFDPHYFRPVQIQGSGFYVPDERFNNRFFPPGLTRPLLPIRLAEHKSPNSYRIFLFGESAANGDPDPTYGFGRYLEILLRERFPGTDFQVACVAITAIDSNVILPIAAECARHEGDLWLIYMGNNEMVGPFGAETVYGPRAPRREIIRAILAVKSTRVGQLLESLLRGLKSNSQSPKHWGGMQMFMDSRIAYDDPARLRAYSNFKGNLEDILRVARRAGVPVLLSTMAVNLKECPPFASVHEPTLSEHQESAWNQAYQRGVALETGGSYRQALAAYDDADKIDAHFADLHFRMARCKFALTNYNEARRDFELARDQDALDFRADNRINSVITQAASAQNGQKVRLVDSAHDLARSCASGIPGLDFFYDHVHFNFTGSYLIASNFAEQVKSLLPASITSRDKGKWATAELCESRLALSVWDRQRVWQPIFNRISVPPFTGQLDHSNYFKLCEARLNDAKLRMAMQTPEQALQMYEQACALAPDDNLLHGNFEQFLEASGDLTNAVREAKRVCQLVPYLPGGYFYVGTLLLRMGQMDGAQDQFREAIRRRPDFVPAHLQLGITLANQGRADEAMAEFRIVLRIDPSNSSARQQLDALRLSWKNP